MSGFSPRPHASESASIRFSVSTELRDPRWDAFLNSVPESHFEQAAGWGAVKAHFGWKVFRVLAFAGDHLVGGVQVLCRQIGRLGKIGYVARGPVTRPGDFELERHLAEKVNAIAAEESWLYCVFDYRYQGHALAATMAAGGYSAHPNGIPPTGLLNATSIVDLSGTEADILARMNRNARRNIRSALTSGLRVSEGTAADLPRFRELMVETCVRRQSSPTPPQKDYFQRLWTELGTRGVRLFVVWMGDEMVSALFAFTLSDTVRLWKSGWSGAHADKFPNQLMFWESMRWAKANGFKAVDLVWIDTEDAKLVARGDLERPRFRDGTTQFKLGFGGALLMCPPAQSRFFHPLYRAAYRMGGRALLSSAAVHRLLARYWSTVSKQ